MNATARSVAFEAVRRVTDEGAYSNLVLPSLVGRSGLEERDRAFATELTYGTLRRLLPIDAALGERSSRPVARMSAGARTALRLGAYQLLYARTPPHAAVSESVGLVTARERGFVNAVLRQVAADPPAPPAGDDDRAVAGRTGLAPWAVAELRRLLGDEAETAAAALAEPADLSLRVNRCAGTVEDAEAALHAGGHEVARSSVDPACLLLTRGDPSRLPGFAEGRFAVQDPASAFVARTVGAAPGDRVLDACAGPGGKTAALACDVEPGGRVVAADLHPTRAGLVRALAARLRLHPVVVAQDATRPAIRGPFDRALVDAPCSGVGSARHRPELLWRVPRERLSALAKRQVAIATSVADLVRPGGVLLYAVCTFPRAETDAACDAIVRHRPELRPVETSGPDGPALRHRLWPHRHGCDAMFVAAFEKSS